VANTFLDANESPYNAPYNRYPDPLQEELKVAIGKQKGISPDCIFLGNGSDEAIDLLYRAFCEPAVHNVVAIDPTYGMYAVSAAINNIEYRPVPLHDDYSFTADEMLAATDANTRLLFLCSPNNPTGNALQTEEIHKLLTRFEGIVVLDEAYIDFSSAKSWIADLRHYPNLVLLQTFSKAYAAAGIRLGMAFATPQVIAVFNKIKYPYNINTLTQRAALEVLSRPQEIAAWIAAILQERASLIPRFAALPCTLHVYSTDANFFLARMTDAAGIYDYLVGEGIIVRNRSNVALCDNCLRVTVGTPTESNRLIECLSHIIPLHYEKSPVH
jgi:histidinol-phosphate aminotransferase